MAARRNKKKTPLQKIRFRLEYLSVLLMAGLVRLLPRTFALRLGEWLGRIGFWLLTGRRRLADENLRLALPELTAEERRSALQRMFAHFGACGVEMLRLDLFGREPGDLQRYFELDGMEYLREAYALGRGVLYLTGHIGFWEGGNFAIPEQGMPFDVVAKPMKNALTDGYITRLRESHGARVLDSKKGARRILQSLQQGRGVAILLDQHIRPPGSVAVDFFGRKAFTTTAITNMAMKYQVPVVPIFIYRLPDDRYRIAAEPMIMLEGDSDPERIRENTQLLTARIEAAVRRDISQWFWMHKRWRVPKDWSES